MADFALKTQKRTPKSYRNQRSGLAPPVGLEPTTTLLCPKSIVFGDPVIMLPAPGIGSYSVIVVNQKRYRIVMRYLFDGSPCWTRTNDNAVNSRGLYRLS